MTTFLSKCRYILAVAMLLIAAHSLRNATLGNVGYLFMSRALGEPRSRTMLENAITWLNRSQPGSRLARTSFRVGQAYALLGDSAQAASVLQIAVEAGCPEVECRLDLADALVQQGATQEAVTRLLDLLALVPLESRVHERLDALVNGPQATAFRLDDRQAAEWPIHLEPSERRVLEAEVPDIRPRWLSVACSGETEASLSLRPDSASGTAPAIALCDSLVRIPIDVKQESRVLRLELGNAGYTPVEVESAHLEYVTNVERFGEVSESEWTQVPHKAIPPLGSYDTYLYLDTDRPRWLTVSYYDYPERDIQVSVEGVPLGAIVGGVRTAERVGGFTPFTFAVSPEAPRLLRVTLSNPNPTYATAVASVYITTH